MTQRPMTTIVVGMTLVISALGVAVTVLAQGHAGHATSVETTKPSRTATTSITSSTATCTIRTAITATITAPWTW